VKINTTRTNRKKCCVDFYSCISFNSTYKRSVHLKTSVTFNAN